MPVVSRTDLPRPKDWQEFETMTAAALRAKWASPNLQMNGRPGQAQQGVDIHGPDEVGRPTGVQCKLTTGQSSLQLVQDELAKSNSFSPQPSTLYIATTQDFDSGLQTAVRALSLTRCQSGLSAVGVLFWDDIVDGLSLNPAVFSNFYPQFQLAGSPPTTSFERISWCVELGYFGANLWRFIELVMGELGWMAQEDPDQIEVTLETLRVHVSRVLPETAAAQARDQLDELRGLLFETVGTKDWARAELLCKRIGTRIQQVLTLQPAIDAQAVRLGMRLGAAFTADEDMIDEAFDSAVETIKLLLGEPSHAVIDARADEIKAGYAMHRPNSLFNLVLREATRRALL